MSKFVLTAALAVAAFGFASTSTARAQYIVNGGYSQGYYGGYSPAYSPGYFSGGYQQSAGPGYYSSNYSYSSFPAYIAPTYPGFTGPTYSPALNSYYDFYRRRAVGNGYNYNRRWR